MPLLLFKFEQHGVQGTSLMALVPLTRLLGLIEDAGVFLEGLLGSWTAQHLSPARTRQVFGACLFLVRA